MNRHFSKEVVQMANTDTHTQNKTNNKKTTGLTKAEGEAGYGDTQL
jgi:hypothetical protein